MNHRERVFTALNHEKPDRCPMQISFTPEFARILEKEMGFGDDTSHNPHGGGNQYMLERFQGQDLLLTSVGWANSYYQNFEPGGTYTDEWGIGWKAVEYKTKFGNGIYTEINEHPLADSNALSAYQAPNPNRDELYIDSALLLKQYRKEYFIVGVTVTTIFETAWALRGLEQLLNF